MTGKKDKLIDWIHKAEWQFKNKEEGDGVRKSYAGNVSSRICSLVTDIHFEKILLTQAEGAFGFLSFGWSVADSSREKKRTWYKISEGEPGPVRDMNYAFVQAVSRADPTARFFIVTYLLICSENDEPPEVSWKIFEVKADDEGVKRADNQKDAISKATNINKKVRKALDDRKYCEHFDNITPWLKELDLDFLQRLFVVRCFMNFSELYLTDIDAIAKNASGPIHIVEFKRKGPAEGKDAFRLIPLLNNTNPIPEYLTRVDNFRWKKSSEIKDELNKKLVWAREEGPCFGLDVSHIKNVNLCYKSGMIYRHIIWNTVAKCPYLILDVNLTPKRPQELLILDVKPQHIKKISKTSGSDSGAYTKNTRFQMMIDSNSFNSLKF